MASVRASIAETERKQALIVSEYKKQLHAERNALQGRTDKLAQEVAKQRHRKQWLELRAPQDGIVKDIATHTVGTVVQPGTVLLTLVPLLEPLKAEVWVSNEDIGFVRRGQPVKLKLAAFPFQKYGMVHGVVEHVGADAAGESPGDATRDAAMPSRLAYKALVALESMRLEIDREQYPLAAGMRTTAEIVLGDRTVLEYVLSPLQKAWHEAGRER